MSQGSLNPKIRFLGQKVCSVAREHTDRHTDTKVTTEGTLSGFQEFFLQPIIKDRPNLNVIVYIFSKIKCMNCIRVKLCDMKVAFIELYTITSTHFKCNATLGYIAMKR